MHNVVTIADNTVLYNLNFLREWTVNVLIKNKVKLKKKK